MGRRIFIFLIVSSCLSGCSQPHLFKETRILMDTFAEISCYGYEKDKTSKAIEEAFREMKRIEKKFSKFDEESEVSKVNRLAGVKEVNISEELFNLMKHSIYYSNISGGSFDITVRPEQRGRYRDVVLDRDKMSVRFLREDIKIDLGGIAKGYAVDRAKDILLSQGIKSALVNLGGNIFALGSPPGKEYWIIGIRDPQNKGDVIYKLKVRNRAISTSATYERPAHIIDPITGEPADDVLSVTVVSDSAEKVDALSTAIFVMGEKSTSKFIKEYLTDTEVYIINTKGEFIRYP